MKHLSTFKLSTIALTTLAIAPLAFADSIPSVVVTVKNQAVQRGSFQTPVWGGIHDGTFDLYDRDIALGDTDANSQLISRESVERIAEDGITDPITEEFSQLQPGAAQTTFLAPGGPLQPGSQSSTTLNINNPSVERYFSYASMVIPSNDAFVANGSPLAHEIFNERGRFVAQNFIVAGSEVLDAGTEVNDEIASNTAFLNQAGANIGTEENGVITLSPGFADPGSLSYPNGVLNHPAFANADFTAQGARTLQFSFRFVDLGGRVNLRGRLSPEQEIATEVIDSRARGRVSLTASNGEQVRVGAAFRGLSGAPVAAHLHLGQAGVNGPIVVDLGAGLRGNSVNFTVRASDIVGPLADTEDPFRSLLNELAAGNIYVNIHTAENPGGEIRGQVSLR
jgi:hypothetical protein